MKHQTIIGIILLAASLTTSAQTNIPYKVTGGIDIKYNTRTSSKDTKGIKDVYSVNINVANSALFHGTITDQPQIVEGIFVKAVTQPRIVNYDLALDVVNPKNPAQTKNVGRLYGTAPISSDGVYHYDTGSLTVDVLPIGQAPGFTSKWKGTVTGKPMNRPANWLDNFRGQAISITRQIQGKPMTVVLKKYDRMVYNQTELGAGPLQLYAVITVSGEMLYDYDKNCWFFNNVQLSYAGRYDRITGTIRWVEDPARKSNGLGEYQFDVRVNEPPPSENAAFAATGDESAFFESDSKVPGLSGTMKYKDSLRGDDTLASSVTIDLTSNNLDKQQVMALTKLIVLSAVVPMNSD